MQVPVLSARGMLIDSKICVIVFLVLLSETVDCGLKKKEEEEKEDLRVMTCGMNNLEID